MNVERPTLNFQRRTKRMDVERKNKLHKCLFLPLAFCGADALYEDLNELFAFQKNIVHLFRLIQQRSPLNEHDPSFRLPQLFEAKAQLMDEIGGTFGCLSLRMIRVGRSPRSS